MAALTGDTTWFGAGTIAIQRYSRSTHGGLVNPPEATPSETEAEVVFEESIELSFEDSPVMQ